MKVSVISRWYNEEFFAPFFLSHYAWADEIIVLLDTTITDKSAEIVSRYPNARVEMKDTGGVLNDRVLSDMMSDYAAASKSDWVIRADADELTFPIGFQNPRESLEQADGNVINTIYRWIYRHHTEGPLDPTKPAVQQRRHGGEYTIWPGMGPCYLKPTIVKPEAKIRWTPGEQNFYNPPSEIKMSSTVWDGVHWQTADVEQWVKRNAANDRRLSTENKAKGWGVKNFTEEMIRAECKAHENDERLF
jgi:Glycosyl transferase family 2